MSWSMSLKMEPGISGFHPKLWVHPDPLLLKPVLCEIAIVVVKGATICLTTVLTGK